ncbi:MAG: SUF system NifU family Fe-S cluster assembly protein [Oscillospiraceae bacterium]|nr:SUF system NifU family Fe-S cluster assembly protein [Oscillospiraceae bacterium]MBQ6756831.1 SUF system NifU family Fe-S cluster assembly protein [Oscillospiraceae bacterium]MBR1842369.1 SUF system NifU family Fe-S cluster assembly protein [Oscillospiraceae bacterium]
MDLRSLYNQVITEKSRSNEHRHPVDDCTCSLEGVNPSCGDDITLQLRVKDGVIEDVGFMGAGCAISQASTALMIDILKGKTVAEAKELIDVFFGMIKGEIGEDDERLELLEDAAALKGIAHTPARVKCAVLAWHTMEEALDK